MFPFALSLFGLSLFDTGLLITIIVFMLLYLVVLIKLKPSIEEEKTIKPKSVKQNIRKSFSTERQNNTVTYHEKREEPSERIKVIERPKIAPAASVETKKTDFSGNNQPSGCPYHFGYLNEHPKNTPIPNECLTCPRIMECLVGG